MAKTRCIILTNGDAARIQEYLSLDMNKKHVQKNGSMISRSVQFPDGFSVRLTCCGVPSGVSYAEAILCDPSGEEVTSSGPQNKILGYWLLPFDGREYALSVSAESVREEPSRDTQMRLQRLRAYSRKTYCALPGFVDSKNEEKTERNAGYLVVSHSGGGMLRQGTREGIRRTPANRGMRAHRIVKGLDISEDVCHGMCP